MTHRGRTRFIQDVTAQDGAVTGGKPFKVQREDKRRFVRLEISSPMAMRKIKQAGGQFWPTGERHVIDGVILNISAGGVLVELDQSVDEGDIVSMRFTLQEQETIDNVLGHVKRTDVDSGTFLVGIEFISRERLYDLMSQDQIDLLPESLNGFNERIREVLGKYVQLERTRA
ncbi:hypothetical protein C3F09_11155 [candidate division GN15 bacterium]|uniref:PilZ domain-containing protein n=1 Tax=candidate division GN15 bacterium TaxID=2072418 RepID=A0A855WX05_9BACT|nr:MAG: hypothetical protein C3F09_11155 [candidate division GN15 bacterium]